MNHKVAPFTDWHTTRKSLLQQVRGSDCAVYVDRVMEMLPRLIVLCGEYSNHRRMILKIAVALTCSRPIIYVPCCPDYGHSGTTYTFQGLGSGVSLLTERHLAFLISLREAAPEFRAIFLLADQEVEDEVILRAVGVDAATFTERIRLSLSATRERLRPYGFEVALMTEALPDICGAERAFARDIAADASKQTRLQVEMGARIPMYQRLSRSMSTDEMLRRTARTAAQYVAMGTFAKRAGALICNHTTTNLSWYGETGVALLHNPISVY